MTDCVSIMDYHTLVDPLDPFTKDSKIPVLLVIRWIDDFSIFNYFISVENLFELTSSNWHEKSQRITVI